MPLDGGSDPNQIDHDNSADKAHIDLKAMFANRQGDWLFIPKDREFEFRNDFSAIRPEEAPFFICGNIPEVHLDVVAPEKWDASGTVASFSAGSETAKLREFKREKLLRRRGPKGESSESLPPPAPPLVGVRDLNIEKVGWEDYRNTLVSVRDATQNIKRWGSGAAGRGQWKSEPVSKRMVVVEGEELAELLDQYPSGTKTPGQVEGVSATDGTELENKNMLVRHDLRRFTINSHPALARAMAKLLAMGKKAEVMQMVVDTLPRLIRRFEHVTGRRVIGASIHWDSNLPHWNFWHSGLERVSYRKGKGQERERFRRTAMNLGSSGPGLRAWRRVELAFARLEKPFCEYTVAELRKAEKKVKKSQNRMPGDWSINEEADAALENLLHVGGFSKEVEEGYAEFVSNEEARYAAGVAGRLARDEREGLTDRIHQLQAVVSQQRGELDQLIASAQVAADEKEQLQEAITDLEKSAEEETRRMRVAVADLEKSAEEEAKRMRATIVELKKSAGIAEELKKRIRVVLQSVLEIPKFVKILRSKRVIWKQIENLASLVELKIDDPTNPPIG